MEPLAIAKLAAKALDDKKAQSIKVLKVEDVTVLTDYFVIATGTSNTHVRALTDEVDFQLSQQKVEPLRKEGMDTRQWALLDYGSVVVNVFSKEAREFYSLDHLWMDGEEIEMEF